MSIFKKQNDIKDLPDLPADRYENIFNVYEAKQKDGTAHYFFNILQKITINDNNLDPEVFTYYIVQKRLPWTAISYKLYDTQHLWWLILAINKRNNPIILPQLGDVLKIIKKEYVNDILREVKQKS